MSMSPAAAGLFLFPWVVTLFYVVAALFLPDLYIRFTYEDLYGEWSQTYLFLATVLFSLLAVRARGIRRGWFFALLAGAAFYTFMEEISWGQRLLGVSTPAFFEQYNIQGETNIHNLFTGPVHSWIKDLLTYAVSAALLGYGCLYPLALRWGWTPARWLRAWGVPPPPGFLWPAFAWASVWELEPFAFNEAEIAELLAGFGVAGTAFHYAFAWRRRLLPEQWRSWPPDVEKRYLYWTVSLLLTVAVLAGATVKLLYLSPDYRQQTERRVTNGYEKFARRYERFEDWPAVADLLGRFDRARPNNTVMLRWLADVYRHMGDEARFRRFNQRALQVGLNRYRDNPDDIAASYSLAKAYRQRGERSLASGYARRAYVLARIQAKRYPKSAHWAYWLAKSCGAIGNHRCALHFYRKAYRLAPHRRRYRRAYFRKKRLMMKQDVRYEKKS